jgi:hypothetical protein
MPGAIEARSMTTICPGSGASGNRDCSTEGPPLPGVTVADVVADVIAAGSNGHSSLYLLERGHTTTTIKTVVDYVQTPAAIPSSRLAVWPSVRAVTDNAAHHKPGLGVPGFTAWSRCLGPMHRSPPLGLAMPGLSGWPRPGDHDPRAG